jgi:beta-lactamase class A
VLGALADAVQTGQMTWQEARPISSTWKSLPSGVMHTCPDGQNVSLLEYATKMISISDNTATDHLIGILGREAIEAVLPQMGNDFVSDNRPFLTTGEMFKLKWALPPSETKAARSPAF